MRKYIGHFMKDGWKGEVPFYLFKCRKHGYVISHEKGFSKELRCPECEKEFKKEWQSVNAGQSFPDIAVSIVPRLRHGYVPDVRGLI